MEMVGRVKPSEAKLLGINKSAILCQFRAWLDASKRGQMFFADGYYWHPIQEKHLHRSFKYMSLEELRNTVGELVDDELLIVGNYQIELWELENWYTMPEFKHVRTTQNWRWNYE